MNSKNIKTEDHKILQIEKKIWHLVLLAVIVILILTLSLLRLQFLKFLGKSEVVVFSDNAYEFSVFLATLILLFCGYMIAQQRKLLQFAKKFLNEKAMSHRLSVDFKTLWALMDVSSRINSKQKLFDILNTITREMLECFQADHSSIMLLDHESKILRTITSLGKGANIDKFIGDEVMAFFGAPNKLKNSDKSALNTAEEMITSFETLKEKFLEKTPYVKELGIGIGVNAGEVFVGNVGSVKRYDYTVIGNAVNLARRLCSEAKSGQILVSEKTLSKISKIHVVASSAFPKNIFFKGIADPVNVYEMAHIH